MKVVILAAGRGSRLGEKNLPKPLTKLANGKSILGMTLLAIQKYFSLHDVIVVVGYHKEKIMEEFPDLFYVYNPYFTQENTSKSLLRALNKVNEDVIWINGDLVFQPSILEALLIFGKTGMVVNTAIVGEEEVKYRTNGKGDVLEVSKIVLNAEGEALGLNFIEKKHLKLFRASLAECSDHDFFERGIEISINKGLAVSAVVVDASLCMEIDFPEDLELANRLLAKITQEVY